MLFIRFSIIIILVISQAMADDRFSSKQCLDSEFKVEIIHPGKFFGLLKNELNIKKKECEIEISHKKIIEKSWKIDICREPVHIKIKDKGSISVVKRHKGCENGNYQEDFCNELESVLSILQDDGLIFAKGKREKLAEQHGQVYCSFLLIKKYLVEGKVFSSFKDAVDLFSGELSENKQDHCDLPVKSSQAPLNSVPVNAGSSEEKKSSITNEEDRF